MTLLIKRQKKIKCPKCPKKRLITKSLSSKHYKKQKFNFQEVNWPKINSCITDSTYPEISKLKKYPPPLTGYIFCLSLPSLLSSSQLTRGIASKIRQINEEFEQPGGRERQKKLRNSKLSSTTFWWIKWFTSYAHAIQLKTEEMIHSAFSWTQAEPKPVAESTGRARRRQSCLAARKALQGTKR